MPRFAANLTMLFTEYPVLERFDRAAAAGFRGVEFLFPQQEDVHALRHALNRNGLEQVLFNLPAGNFAAGERGFANNPDRTAEFRDGVAQALDIAAVLGCPKINCLVGLALPDVPIERQWDTLRENLNYAATEAAKAGVLQVVEPLNSIDVPGFILDTPSRGFALIEEIDHPNLKVQYDLYHAQRMEGNLTATLHARMSQIGHIQVADSPARNEPGTGELNYPFLFAAIDAAGYDGWVSGEYKPSQRTENTLGWIS